MPSKGTLFSMGFVADLFYLDLIGRFRCKAATHLHRMSAISDMSVLVKELMCLKPSEFQAAKMPSLQEETPWQRIPAPI